MEENPEFFKVLLDGFEEKLTIPRAFNEHISKQMVTGRRKRRKATLCSPLGNKWPVKLDEDAGKFYFSKGWPEFVRAHKLLLGYFLVFISHGDLRFTVKVFDRSTCVKRYPSTRIATPIATPIECVVLNSEDEDDNLSHDATQSPSRMSQSIVATESPLSLLPQTKKRRKMKNDRFQADKPHSFSKIIRPFHLHRHFINVPKLFCEMNGLVRKNEVILKDPRGKTWPVNFNVGKGCFYFVKGWKEFLVGNNMREGDKCIFNLKSKGNGIEFRVQIRRC